MKCSAFFFRQMGRTTSSSGSKGSAHTEMRTHFVSGSADFGDRNAQCFFRNAKFFGPSFDGNGLGDIDGLTRMG